ncbi:MAG: RNA-directed DNA polymerase [Candidatus Tenebribacter davisii]|nr:RNA-directed DNA polymerase [Candidatus Tenebribacter davisii]
MTGSKSILKLNHTIVIAFFLKHESYCNIDLPSYINFKELLECLSKEIAEKSIKDICIDWKNDNPADYENINHVLISNKDGLFAWRPLKLIHPVLYVLLVHKISSEENWVSIVNRLNRIRKHVKSKITCKSIPRIATNEDSDKAAQISNWWRQIEQASLKMSLDYTNIIHADITDCYGSIYTHSIPWALHGKRRMKQKANRNNFAYVGNSIDGMLRNMSFGQTNGIPQGSILMDFLAEIVLAYIDLKLFSLIKRYDCKIFRYRDDYRIFTNNEADGMEVLKNLSEVLLELGLKLNTGKTIVSNDVIKESIKQDKWSLLGNVGRSRNFQKYLMFIHKLSSSHPNSGSIVKELTKFYDKLVKQEKLDDDIEVMIAIITDIAYKNPTTYSISSAILSKLFSLYNFLDREEIFNKIKKRFDHIPNTDLIDLWLQRITYSDFMLKHITFKEPLSILVSELDNTQKEILWESSWLEEEYKQIIAESKIVNSEILEDLDSVIDPEEVKTFVDEYF